MLTPFINNQTDITQDSPRQMETMPISEDEYKRIIEAIPMNDVNAILLFKILRNTGARINEIKSITPANIGRNGPETWLETTHSKSRSKTPLYHKSWLNWAVGDQLNHYVAGNRIQMGEQIFPRTYTRYWQIWKKASIKAIGRPTKPHQIRGLFSTFLLDNGASPAQVAAFLGHKDIKTTLAHYNKMNEDKKRTIGQNMPV